MQPLGESLHNTVAGRRGLPRFVATGSRAAKGALLSRHEPRVDHWANNNSRQSQSHARAPASSSEPTNGQYERDFQCSGSL